MLSHAIEVLGWTLLHFVWQGAVVGVLTAAMLLVLRRRSANARYLAAVSALSLMLLLPIGTIAWIEQTPPVGEVSPIFNTISMIEIPRTREDGTLALDEPPIKVERIGIDFENPPPPDAVPMILVSDTGKTILEDLAEQRSAFGVESFLKPFIPWAVSVWLIGVGVLSLRLFASWLSVLRLRRRATQPASANWQAMLGRLAERLRVTRPVRLVESALVAVPAVIGWLRPVILLPASAMTGLTTEQLEALLAHELAHVRRHDYLINLLQTVVETLLFYHPAVWWVSHRIRVEREHCCDDLAASVCGDRLSYAKALVAMEELRAPKLRLMMSSSGGSLLVRVARLVGQAEQQRRPTGWFAGLLLILLTMAGALGAGLLTPPENPTEGIPNDTQPISTKSTDKDEETFGPTQRRGPENSADREVENDPEMKKILVMCIRDAAAALANGRLELVLEQEHFLKPSADKPDGEVAKSMATSRWIGEGPKWRVDYEGRMLRSVENRVVNEWLPLQWTAGFDGQQHYQWDRANKQIELGREFAMALQHSPARLFFGFTVADLEMLLAAPKTKASAITHQGLKCIQVDAELVVQSKTQRFVFILCPEHGYLPLENRFYADGQFVGETKFSDFYEPRAGVWAARKIQVKSADPENPNMEKPLERIIHTVKRLDLGETAKLQAEEFRADPPEGTKRIDSTKPGDLRSENDINIRFAEKSVEVARAEWVKMLEANQKVPGSIPATEIERAKLRYEKVVLQIEQAEFQQRIHQLELELALGQNKEDGLEQTHKTLELRWLRAKVAADLAKAEHDKIVAANRRVPRTIPEAEVAKAQKAEEAARSQLERAQIELQINAELTKLTEVAFTDLPLTDAVTFLSDNHNIPVELDATARKFEVSPVTLTVTCGDLAEMLTLVLHPMKLSYCIDSGRLLIATPEEVQRLGHKPPQTFAEELAILRKADDRVDWEALLRGQGSKLDPAVLTLRLSRLLDSDDVTVQHYAARGLAQFDLVAAPARPRLEKLTRSKDTRVARGAWLALVSIGHEDFSTLPLMLAELDRAEEPFGQLWPALIAHFDESVWDELTKAFPKSSLQVRATLAASVRYQSARSLPVALLALEDAEHRVRRTALNSIRYEAPPAKLVSALQARLKDEALDIRVQAAGRLLSYGKAVNEAVELLLSELLQADQGRASVALHYFTQVHSPEAIRAVVDALDVPTRSKDTSRRRAAWRALMFLNLTTGRSHPTEVPWGPTRAGLRTRLSVVASKSDRPPYAAAVGEPIKLKLELKNFGDQPVEYDAQQAEVNQPLIVVDDDMRPVKRIAPQLSITGTNKTIKPGETHVLVEQLDLTAQYDLKQPGNYYIIRWTQDGPAAAPDDPLPVFVPNSNVLTLLIQKAEGNGDKPAEKEGDLRSDAAAGSGDPRRAPAAKLNSVRERLQNRISLSLENVPLSQVVEHIGRESKIAVRLDSDALENDAIPEDNPVSISVDGISTASALYLLLQPIQLGYVIENETLVVTTVARLAMTPVDERLDLGKALADEAKMSLLKDAIQTFVEPKTWDVAGGSGSIRFDADRKEFVVRNVPLIQYEVDRFLTHILPRSPSPELQRLRKLLAQRFTLELGEVTLRDAVRKIAAAADANVVLDANGLDTAGIRSDRRVTLNYKDTPLRDILDGLCKPLKLRFRIQNDVIQITDEETAQSYFFAVLYPVSTPADGLTHRIQSIRPESWKFAGGQGTIEPHRPTNSLIIRQHEDVHDDIVQLIETTQSNDKPNEEQRKLPPPKGEIYDAASPGTDRITPKNGSVSGAISGKRRDRDSKMLDQFTGRVRLKTEKPLPDLEKVIVPAGKVLDESLVFSKEGGLANVFVYLQMPTFPIEPPPSNRPPKPFIMIAEGGRFWPHAAFVRVGRPIVFENRQTDPVNFFMNPQRNVSFNVVAKVQDQVKLQALRTSEKFPFVVKSTIQPWMQAHLLTLDHPFAAVTDEEGRFTINGLPPGDHEFHVWHERVGYLEKSLRVTIKAGEPTRTQLEYEPQRFKLEEAEVLNWGNRQIESVRNPMPQQRVRPRAVEAPKDKAKVESPDSAQRGLSDPAAQSVAELPTEKDGIAKPELSNLKSEISNPKPDAVKPVIERGVAFLKVQQQEWGAWPGTPADGVTALTAAALLQAGVKADDPVIQKALAHLRKVEPALSYTVALQTMVFCWASPKEDAELIRRNVTWLEKAQVPDGKSRGAWSYQASPGGRGDGSCSRFAVLGLDAAKKAGFEIKEETWRRVSDYWLTSQKENGGWGYMAESPPTLSMTLAGIAGLATANRHLPRDEQSKAREAAIRKPETLIEKSLPAMPNATFVFYALHSLERAGHLSGITRFGELDWNAELTKRLLESQHLNGFWKGATATEGDIIATSLALLALTGQPEPKQIGYRLRFEPRDVDKPFRMLSNLIENSSPPMQRTVISGGLRIEFLKPDGLKCRIEADRAIIESDVRAHEDLDLNPESDVMRIECIGSVKCEDRRGTESTQLIGERLSFDVGKNRIRIEGGGN